MRVDERLLKYVRVWTTSDEESQTSPTTERQFDLARMLVQEMREIGIKDADMDKYGYVYGHVPATQDMKTRQPLDLSHTWIPHRITVERTWVRRSSRLMTETMWA